MLIAPLIESIKELKLRNDSLEEKIVLLEANLKALEARIADNN